MCTVSWLLANDGYQVFFNRDEQKGRALAHAPKYFNDLGVKYLMPVDPVGGGSWIAMNQAGLSICLLNYYQQKPPGKELISRGLLVKSLVSNTSLPKIRSALNKLPLQRYAAFTLLVFPSHLTAKTGDVYAVRWDGCELSSVTAVSPMVSSSVALAEVTNYREDHHNSILLQHQVLFSGEGCNDDLDIENDSQNNTDNNTDSHRHTKSDGKVDRVEENIIELTNQRCLDDKNSLALTRFHASHEPTPSYLSVCMHRDDAHTVSFTHLIATRKQLKMNYVCGCPCSSKQHQSYALYPQRETYVEVV
ncbi:NRDE family protein [Moritella marina ATCC 15381]|uniref:NRDE family protein n=1 Tax=Moritella marina ATCC 15381 TaxID=1202962 RepID=A0A5J6WP19_MORMI|nr:NRDE family protein [Moritella marina]QFI38670.1 NRDE family protein [Moritella marina ATCC 15381]